MKEINGVTALKKFKYYGREVEVPDYAQYIAVDADGEAWWYVSKPSWSYVIGKFRSGGNCGRVGYFDNVTNWKWSVRSC